MLSGRLLPPSLPLLGPSQEGRRRPREGWQGKEEGRSRPFKSRGAEPCDLQGSAQWYFLPEKGPNRNIGKIENYIIIIITIYIHKFVVLDPEVSKDFCLITF